MTSELEQRLREALNEDAERARLVNPDRPPAADARRLSDGQHPRRPARRLVAVAAAIVLVVAAGVAVIQDREREPDVTTEDPMTAVFEDLSLGDAEVYTDIPPGATVELPPPPIGERSTPAVVWTGTEMIVWGGMDADQVTLDDGAAFDLATGTWRVIASAPIEPRLYPAVAWTGTEMLVWGGQTGFTNGTGLTDGAAYDPTTDTWRRLPDGPFDGWQFGVRECGPVTSSSSSDSRRPHWASPTPWLRMTRPPTCGVSSLMHPKASTSICRHPRDDPHDRHPDRSLHW